MPVARGPHDNLPPGDHDVVTRHAAGGGSEMFAGALTGERRPAVQADRAATRTTAAAVTTLTARMLIRTHLPPAQVARVPGRYGPGVEAVPCTPRWPVPHARPAADAAGWLWVIWYAYVQAQKSTADETSGSSPNQ